MSTHYRTHPRLLPLSLLLLLTIYVGFSTCQRQHHQPIWPQKDEESRGGHDAANSLLPYPPPPSADKAPRDTGSSSAKNEDVQDQAPTGADSNTLGNKNIDTSQAARSPVQKQRRSRRTKRYSNFVRVGRGGGGNFVRIGKSFDEGEPLDDFSNDFNDDILAADKRQMHRFIRIGRGLVGDDDDDSSDRLFEESNFADAIDERPFSRLRKSPSSFVRIGRAPNSFVRIGKSHLGSLGRYDDDAKRASSFVRIGRSLKSLAGHLGAKRASSFVRIGKSPPEISGFFEPNARPYGDENEGLPLANLPYSEMPEQVKRASSFVRIGKSPFDTDLSNSKRPSSFVRIGKSSDFGDDDQSLKRASSFVRIGKSSDFSDDDQSLKRASSFVRIGKSDPRDKNDDLGVDEKRAGNFVRIGRIVNPSNFNGDSNSGSDNDNQKNGFPRSDKKDDSNGDDPTSGPSALPSADPHPLGTESLSDGNLIKDSERPINLVSRGSAFVRIGKIPSSAFVRIGKNTDVVVEHEPGRVFTYNQGARGGQSSFVRIGK